MREGWERDGWSLQILFLCGSDGGWGYGDCDRIRHAPSPRVTRLSHFFLHPTASLLSHLLITRSITITHPCGPLRATIVELPGYIGEGEGGLDRALATFGGEAAITDALATRGAMLPLRLRSAHLLSPTPTPTPTSRRTHITIAPSVTFSVSAPPLAFALPVQQHHAPALCDPACRRPGDPSSHAIFGDPNLTTSFVLRVPRGPKGHQEAEVCIPSAALPPSVSPLIAPAHFWLDRPRLTATSAPSQIVAKIPISYSFNGMADFQFVNIQDAERRNIRHSPLIL